MAPTGLQRHERKLEYLAAGGEVKVDANRKRITNRDAAQDWIEGHKLFVGKDGQGMSRKTVTAYRSRMDFFAEFCASLPA